MTVTNKNMISDLTGGKMPTKQTLTYMFEVPENGNIRRVTIEFNLSDMNVEMSQKNGISRVTINGILDYTAIRQHVIEGDGFTIHYTDRGVVLATKEPLGVETKNTPAE